jgi:hypothetical protein
MSTPIDKKAYKRLMNEFGSSAELQKKYPQFQYGHDYAMHILEGTPLSKPVTPAPVASCTGKTKIHG